MRLLGRAGLALLLGACPSSDPAPIDAGAFDATASDILTDELSMPATPTVSLDNFIGSQNCGACHPQHYLEWRTSMHAYAMIDPVYRQLVALRQADFGGAQDRFCLQCHTPIGTRAGDIVPGFDFEQLAPVTLEGVNCETCHRASDIARNHSSGLVLDDTGPIRGPIENPLASDVHLSEYAPMFDTSDFCSTCHDVLEVNGLELERPFVEWQESPAAAAGQNCQSCHMPTYEGTASIFSSTSPNVHQHFFTGVDLPLSDDFVTDPVELDAMRARTKALLAGAATVTLASADTVTPGAQLDVYVTVKNNINAHNFPTGSTFNREVWLELTATDGNGQILYQTGDLDANGDLRGHFSELDPYGDQDLIVFGSRLVDDSGTPQRLSWRATDHFSNSLSPLYDRTVTLFVPTDASTVGPITIDARVRFRSFGPHLLRMLGLFDEIDRLEIHEVDATSRQVGVTVAP